MFTINIEKECGCFKKSDLQNNKSFDNKDDTLTEAMKMVEHMNNEFCQKHEFVLNEDGHNFTIKVDERAKEQTQCCGGGHCS